VRGRRAGPSSGAVVTKSEQNKRTCSTGKGLLYSALHLSRLSGHARPAFPLEGPRGSVESFQGSKGWARSGSAQEPRKSRVPALRLLKCTIPRPPAHKLSSRMFYGLATAVWLHAPSRLASRRMIRICTVSPGKSMYITCFSRRTGTGLLAESAKRKSSPSDT